MTVPADPQPGSDLAAHLGVLDPAQRDAIEETWTAAVDLVSRLAGTATVPPAVRHRAQLQTGAALWEQRRAPLGVVQFADAEGSPYPVRVAADPTHVARSLLAPYLPGGFA